MIVYIHNTAIGPGKSTITLRGVPGDLVDAHRLLVS